MADEQEALLAQIRALSGAIDQRRSNGTTQQASYRGGGGRGAYHSSTRGTRRGGAHVAPLPSRHRSLVISGSNAGPSTVGDTTVAAGPSDGIAASSSSSSSTGGQEGWVKRKTTHNMSLVSSSTFEKNEQARLAANAAIQAKQAAKAATAGPSKLYPRAKGKSQASVRRGDNMGEVIIDGVTFEFDETGTKLVKKVAPPAAASEESDKPSADSNGAKDQSSDANGVPSSPSTPLRTSINGQQFIRTKTGNLISQALLDQRRENKRNSEKLKRLEEASKEIAGRQLLRSGGRGRGRGRGAATAGVARKKILCAYFNKTGQCKNGLSCPYKHDLARVAICPRFLRSTGCPLPAGTCPLSHDPKDERVPHCVHYLATAGSCRNGDACTYVHPAEEVNITNASPICMNFSDFGWCSKGRTCPQRHTWDCPEFLRKGKCDRRGCKLMHVVRVPPNEASGNNVKGARQLNDEELFVRDDDQTVEQNEEDEEDVAEPEASERQQTKRKRGVRIHDAQPGDDEEQQSDGSEAETGEEVLRFKTRKSKAFSGQNDFISFDDMEDEESEGEELVDEEEADANLHIEDEEASSVHSKSSDEEE